MKTFFEMVTGAFRRSARPASAKRRGEAACAVYARIEEALMPLDRGRKYEDPLNRALIASGYGRVTGGGSVQGRDGAIEWISLDVELVDLGPALEFLRTRLLELGAAPTTVLKFRKDGVVLSSPLR